MALSAAASLRSVAPGVGRPKSSSTRLAAAVQPVYHVGVSPHPPPRFTPVESALGGVLVGTAAASFMLALGRVCGISGLVASTIIDPTTQGKADVVNVLFLLGLFGGGCLGLAGCLGPSCVGMAQIPEAFSTARLVAAGLCVGLGTRWANGCTSGHALCGVGRGSLRSVIATATFVAAGIATASLLPHSAHLSAASLASSAPPAAATAAAASASLAATAFPLLRLLAAFFLSQALLSLSPFLDKASPTVRPGLSALSCGVLFGAGLAASGLSRAPKVLAFLRVGPSWDPSLALMFATALAVSAIGSFLAKSEAAGGSCPLLAPEFRIPNRKDIDARLVGGAALFGVGWGLAGLCPGPAVVNLALPFVTRNGAAYILPFFAAMLVGMKAAPRLIKG